MMKLTRKLQGQLAEQAACDYLLLQGLNLWTKNYRCIFGEIDLVMLDKDDIVFIEVRSRGRIDYGKAAESITGRKIQKLLRTALFFLQQKELLNTHSSRFDIIGIDIIKQKQKFLWIKNAFEMTI